MTPGSATSGGPSGPRAAGIPGDGPAAVEVTGGGEVTDEELAAIVAAVEAAMPGAQPATRSAPAVRWRFSGRWWSKPAPLRRSRPWR